MGKLGFLAAVFGGVICTWMGVCMNGYTQAEFALYGKEAVMQLADPNKKLTIPVGGYDVHLVNVRYVSASGELVVSQKRLTGDEARRLDKGEKIPIIYLETHPHTTIYSRDDLPKVWGWFIAAIAATGLAIYAWKLARHEGLGGMGADAGDSLSD